VEETTAAEPLGNTVYRIGCVETDPAAAGRTDSDMSGVKISPGSSSAAWHTGSAEWCHVNIHLHLKVHMCYIICIRIYE
jgi:hypothetical protein